jgi:dTDP-4-dehydrorhamnose reductase
MTKILVTGANGQLGNELRSLEKAYPAFSFIFTDYEELDITNKTAVDTFFEQSKPDYLINCAAYTAVDKAETEQDKAYLLNADAPCILAMAATKFQCKYIHISTDYVFDGSSYIPYTETMPIKPMSVYGTSKAMGETNVIAEHKDAIIIRTSWLYSSFGNNFVKSMIKYGNERDELNIVFDQVGTPTYAHDLAHTVLEIISKTAAKTKEWIPGIYHYSNEGVCSWYDFTKEIHAIKAIKTCNVKPIESKDYPTPVRRPHYSVLNKKKIKTTFDISIPYWKDSLEECLKLL